MSVVFMISGATDSCEITLITCSPIVTSSFAQNGGKFLFLIQGKKNPCTVTCFSIELTNFLEMS